MTPHLREPSSPAPARAVPPGWSRTLAGYDWHREAIGRSSAAVFRLAAAGRPTLFVKTEPSGLYCELIGEAMRLRWLKTRGIACPDLLALDAHAGRHWMLTRALPGRDLANSDDVLPSEIVVLVADALRTLHEVDPANCPFGHNLAARIALAGSRAAAGRVDEADFDDERRGRSAAGLHAELLAKKPVKFDLVLAHGDASLPNLIADRGVFTGFVDCGRFGIADRYQDLALAASSIGDALGVDWITPFLAAYGLDRPDQERLTFYSLLDEFF